MAFPDGWGRAVEIVIPDSQIDGNNTGLPVLLTADNFPSEAMDTGANSALNGGGDLRFTTDLAGSNQIPVDVFAFITNATPASRLANVWVKPPTLNTGADRSIYGWYNKAGETQPVVTDPYGRNAVWDGFHRASHDLVTDSAGNGTFAEVGDENTTPSDGPFDVTSGARDFNPGFLQNRRISDDFDVTSQHPISVQAWTKTPTPTESSVWCASVASSGFGVWIGLKVSTTEIGSEELNNGDDQSTRINSGTVPSSNTWFRVTYSGTTTSARTLYANGVNSGSNTGDGGFAWDNTFNETFLGRGISTDINSEYSGQFNGDISEYRIAKTNLSDDWVSTEFNNQDDPAIFAIPGTPFTPGGPPVGATIPVFMQHYRNQGMI